MPGTRLDLDRIRAARRLIDPVFLDTPLYRCDPLERELGCAMSLKLETANPVRCFKGRGTEVLASQLVAGGGRAAVCASAGNLGQALAWSGPRRDLDVTVVAARSAPAAKLDRIRALGAELLLVDGDIEVARDRASRLAERRGIRLVEDSLGAPALTRSWHERRVVTTDSIDTIADGVAGRYPIPEAVPASARGSRTK